MKKSSLFIFCLLLVSTAYTQEELHIHHINIENGDATMIGVYNKALQKYTVKTLIDGGQVAAGTYLLPYFAKICSNDGGATHFNYVILTHYHNDHYTGLLALGTGKLTADSVIDPGGYNISTIFSRADAVSTRETKPDSLRIALAWIDAMKSASHHSPAFVKGRSHAFVSYGTTSRSGLGHRLIIGQVNGHDLVLECVAGWGNTLNGHGITANPSPGKSNANDFTLAFILTCGEFRYFIGGDMGGDDQFDYINQEPALQAYLVKQFPSATAATGGMQAAGHICGYKANHHGSQYSNTSAFMQAMLPAITITSAGDNSSWQLPNPNYLERLSKVKALSQTAGSSAISRGVYITNLYNFSRNHSLDKAVSCFAHKQGTSFDYGNNTSAEKAGYMVKVNGDNIGTESSFDVFRVNISASNPFKLLAHFNCHTH